jgi:hypothetical protein
MRSRGRLCCGLPAPQLREQRKEVLAARWSLSAAERAAQKLPVVRSGPVLITGCTATGSR